LRVLAGIRIWQAPRLKLVAASCIWTHSPASLEVDVVLRHICQHHLRVTAFFATKPWLLRANRCLASVRLASIPPLAMLRCVKCGWTCIHDDASPSHDFTRRSTPRRWRAALMALCCCKACTRRYAAQTCSTCISQETLIRQSQLPLGTNEHAYFGHYAAAAALLCMRL